MSMEEAFEYRYGIKWEEFQDANTKFLWVMVWEHAKDYYTRGIKND